MDDRGLIGQRLDRHEARLGQDAGALVGGLVHGMVDNGFFLASPDGAFRLRIKGYLQFRWILDHRDDSGPGQDSTSKGFENSRTQVFFEGHVVDPSWIFRIQGEFGRSGGVFRPLDAWLGKRFDCGATVYAG